MNQNNAAALVSIINLLLLEEELIDKIELEYNKYNSSYYTITEDFDIVFDRVNRSIEFCFVVSQFDNGLRISINGVTLPVVRGENCFILDVNAQQDQNEVKFYFVSGSGYARITGIDIAPTNPGRATLSSLSRSDWDERAVRKVLKIFAFGGHARDSQITEWAQIRPLSAIRQMLNFSENNSRLSPLAVGEKYRDTVSSYGTFSEFLDFISDDASDIPIPVGSREPYGINGYLYDESFIRMVTVRGLNPFRQRIGFWETNYHLAVNLNASVSMRQMAKFYDLIMEAHEANLPYHEIMGIAAKSAAAAMQYGHRENRWNVNDQVCECNQDFAREIHQLYYGIFGSADPNHHENVTIPETAKMLTGMPVPYLHNSGGFSTTVLFGQGVSDGHHHMPSVNVLNTQITGGSAAAKINRLMPVSMQHPESLENLPIMIISGLADDNLSEAAKDQLRTSWESLQVDRKLLDFIHAYAISDLFHSPAQFKYLTSHERALYLANKRNLDNVEAYTGGNHYDTAKGRQVGGILEDDFAGDIFRPLHNVFGGQTSTEASDSAVAFENNYNDILSRESWELTDTLCDNCDNGDAWEKKWAQVLPKRNGQFYVDDVAEWLWMHAVGNLDNFTELERAHLYPILAAVSFDPSGNHDREYFFDFNYLMCVVADYKVQHSTSSVPLINILTRNSNSSENWYNFPYCREIDGIAPHEEAALSAALTGDQIANDPEIQAILTQLGGLTIPLNEQVNNEAGKKVREYALNRIDTALDFIFTTPFIFAEGETP